MYELFIARQAIKDLERIPPQQVPKIMKAIEALKTDPRPAGCKKLKGKKEVLWRIRVGDHRVIYDIKDVLRIVQVRAVGDRKNIYR